ncbi:MAG: HD domain-containing protein [Desulfurococcaceae archaeon]|nr:HD domain-containing protein [Desulfurococcaceae archaeon]
MVIVNAKLLEAILPSNELLFKAYRLIASDFEVQTLWYMSNIMAVNRLKYNDHGPVHAHIVAGTALYLYQLLRSRGVESTLMRDGVVENEAYTWLIPLLGGLLHDIGNSVHRHMHEATGALLAKPIIDRVLEKLIEEPAIRIRIRQEIMHSIHCTSYDVECLTIEAGCVKVADGLDMAEGRARVPYKLGGVTIHSVSALSIKKVEIIPSDKKPIRVNVYMSERAGIFQVDEVLMPKLNTTPLRTLLEIYILVENNVLKHYP